MFHFLWVPSVRCESFTEQPGPACVCSGSPFPPRVPVAGQASLGWTLHVCRSKQAFRSSIGLASQAAGRFLMSRAHLLLCGPGLWQRWEEQPLLAGGFCWAPSNVPEDAELRAARLHVSVTFFRKTCFGACSLESIPASWRGHQRAGAVCALRSAGALSLCLRVKHSWRKRDSKARTTGAKETWEIFRAEVFKGFSQVKFSGKWGMSGRTPYSVWPYFWLWLILQHLLCIF